MKTNFSNYIKKLGIFLMLTVAITANAQENYITLEKAKKAALQYSHDIKNGNLRIEKAAAQKQEAIANYFPTVEALGGTVYAFDNFIDPIALLGIPEIDNVYLASATASEVVFAGGKVKNANKLAEVQVRANQIRAEQSIDSVIITTEKKYWQLVQLQEQQKVITAAKIYLAELLKQQQDLLDAGLIAKNQLLKVKVNRSKILLKESKLSNTRKLALLDLALYTGLGYDTTMVAIDSLHQVVPPEMKYENTVNVSENTNYKLLDEQIQASKLQTKMAEANRLPQISVGVNANKYGTFNADIDSDIQALAFGAVRIPISAWWGKEKQQIKQQKIQEKIAVNQLKKGQDQIKIGIMKSWYDLIDAYKQIDYAKENLDYAEENLDMQRDNYNSGLNNLSDLLDAQRLHQEAKTEWVNAFANYQIKETVYLYRNNQLDAPSPEELSDAIKE
ncbi:TolC family protein [Zunongwangia endophytica]|uniref:TolC family protein n=1 Tax=Zunongwangia endophytica TaxID=1808945 RepID=A0ABV8HBE8_9FLAO|nr:TolC family protein [Zunongwangia endophytica]MDN3593687.1 TolC family protein [Zunongwangia endophytica]